jgi:hypothetical protein
MLASMQKKDVSMTVETENGERRNQLFFAPELQVQKGNQ